MRDNNRIFFSLKFQNRRDRNAKIHYIIPFNCRIYCKIKDFIFSLFEKETSIIALGMVYFYFEEGWEKECFITVNSKFRWYNF
jgi:hypothetical protein